MKKIPLKNSIQMKLFLTFFLSMAGLIVLGILLNNFFFEQYYLHENQKSLREITRQVVDYVNSNASIEPYIEKLGKEKDVTIEIIDQQLRITHSSIAHSQHNDHLPSEIESLIKNLSPKSTSYQQISNHKNTASSQKLVFIASHHQQYIVVSSSMRGILESVVITNQFTLLIGIVTIVIGSFVTLVIARRVAKPILQMSQTADDIARLKFDQTIDVKGADEISILADSINSISSKLATSIQSLQDDIDRRKQLVRDISHELKTPIGVIKGYSEGLKYDVVSNELEREKYLETIINECDQMDSMVKEMIELSKYESKDLPLNFTTIKTKNIINLIEERFAPIFEQQAITFTYEATTDKIYGDYKLINRAISNYITNAVKHVGEQKQITLSIKSINHMVVFNVYNSDSYIDKKELNKIWDPFYKVDSQRERNSTGSGLGLSMVKEIAQLHHGTVEVKSIDDGVIFSLIIPSDFS